MSSAEGSKKKHQDELMTIRYFLLTKYGELPTLGMRLVQGQPYYCYPAAEAPVW
jgi:hypothetical protein